VSAAIPADFEPVNPSPFTELIGPLYINTTGELPVVAVQVGPQHANRRGRAHGGLLMTLADVALSRAVHSQLPPGGTLATADLHIAFVEAVDAGAWLEAIPTVDRLGRGLVHASCVLRSGEVEVGKVLATFAIRVPGLD
jgi:acyl-coenzyme A thioesterase 13